MKQPVVFISLFIVACLVATGGCASSPHSIATPSGLVYTVLKKGSGPAARAGQHVLVHETVTFTDGRLLFSSRGGGPPARFLVGGNQAIDGVDEGVTGMRVGERRMFIIPPALSKRSRYPEGLSPADTLHYDVELIGIEQP